MRSKFRGCLLGCAVGDALGCSWGEFSGRWTDDTHMMMGLAESLVERKGFDGEHVMRTFIKNYEQEPWRGYASGPPTIFSMVRRGVPWNEASRRLFGGMGSFGNGAAMRVAPVGLLYHDDPGRLREVAEQQALLTHSHELGREGAVLQARAVSLALTARPPSLFDPCDFLEELRNFTAHPVYREKLGKVKRLVEGGKPEEVVRELGNGVEAHRSVPTAICSFLLNFRSFRASLLYATGLGGDRDTIGAMTGALSGAYHGEEGIPEEWREKVEGRERLEKLADELWGMKLLGI
ncbi:MAG: ADP-ribosylglycohydrolase family protein [Candidatus Hadarchaeales archaeon]